MTTINDILICPITQQIMTDPVSDADGNTYERTAILEWLRLNNTSPITRRPMTPNELVPNRMVRDLITAAQTASTPVSDFITNSIQQQQLLEQQQYLEQQQQLEQLIATNTNPITVVIALDASGSMSGNCDLPGEKTGMTRIDLTKYSARVIIESLYPGDRIGLVAFSNRAYDLAPLRQINTPHDKQELIHALDSYRPDGATNIFDAVAKSINMLTGAIQPGEPATIFLLTDGEPTVNPPDTHNQGVAKSTISGIQRTLLQHPDVQSVMPNITINAFGYGYSLLPELMTGLTKLGTAKPGVFGFIPDASMLGSVLINALSHTRFPESAELTHDEITLCNQVAQLLYNISQSPDSIPFGYTTALVELATNLSSLVDRSPFTDALLLDLLPNDDPNLGQISKAIAPEHYRKWGRFYLMSLTTAFQIRACLNFKDNALQCFKTPEMSAEQTRLSDIFLTSTPPVPSGNRASYSLYGSASAGIRRGSGSGGYTTPIASMATYLNAAGGCFGPQTLIMSADGTPIPITELKPGTAVMSAAGITTIECIVRQPYSGDLYQINTGLWLTAWHPFATPENSSAYFPAEYPHAIKLQHSGVVYNLVLANRELIASCLDDINTTEVQPMIPTVFSATLGHRNTHPVFAHPYYGTEAAIDDLKETGEYTSGYINVMWCDISRDSDTQLVNGIAYYVV